MISYVDITRYFGLSLSDATLQDFLSKYFSDLTSYNVTEGDYIISDEKGIGQSKTQKGDQG